MTFTDTDLDDLLAILRQASRDEILPRFRQLAPSDISAKSAHDDLVTEADIRAEKAITAALRDRHPDALVIGEEAIAARPSLRNQLTDAKLAFVVDPVDGTWNFARGLATFGVILSANRLAEPVLGALYDPLFDDAICALEDGPAVYIRKDRTRDTLRLDPAPSPGLTGFLPLNLLPEDKRPAMAAVYPSVNRVLNLRCSCHEFRQMALGHVDFMLSARLTPWDHAAGALIVARAGGVVRMLEGAAYRSDVCDGYLLCARSEEVWHDIAGRLSFLLD
ncbi:inositol monophosphatase family protein [Pseudaestuariivita sp.]|uniref:inositol monophosphatase family protein n=1 Tax=Pseudaestuariivita sp. TaxID=2211669 RepID=UPI00405938F2